MQNTAGNDCGNLFGICDDATLRKSGKQLQIEKLDKLLVSKWVGVYSKYLGKDEEFVKDLMISTAKESFPREYSDYC